MTFKHSRALGRSGEDKVVALYEECGFITSKNNTASHDIKVEDPEFTTEVKFDKEEVNSGRIAIEVRNSKKDKPSGLYATESDIWAHVLADFAVYITRVPTLISYVGSHKPIRVVKFAGDKNAEIWLYESAELLQIFHRIDNCSIEDRMRIITEILNV